MRKLKLQVEALVVDSFEAVDSRRKAEGTVGGYESFAPTDDPGCETTPSNGYQCSRYCSGPSQWQTCDGPTCNSPDCIETM
ncbi:MAG TPA: hypothetical protein VGC13_08130 [Longimicrobium sp.]|jgi:hypothetical protein|uniref:hypothetical protein n=1 Tax=Longimicrobium sp. TaxID=2029185 RepID=UPI002ED8F5B4